MAYIWSDVRVLTENQSVSTQVMHISSEGVRLAGPDEAKSMATFHLYYFAMHMAQSISPGEMPVTIRCPQMFGCMRALQGLDHAQH